VAKALRVGAVVVQAVAVAVNTRNAIVGRR
jgi:hypothetical protein